MKVTLLLASIVLFWYYQSSAQAFTDSNLPIVIINTDNGVEIPDAPRVLANLKIIYKGTGARNYVADQDNAAYLNYNGRIDIEIRGSSSQSTPKKQYGFTTRKADNVSNNNVSLLGLPTENDWILNSMTFDSAKIRDYLCYNLSRQLGQYASRTVYCEVMINGAYNGLYLLQEKIKSNENRVNIIKIGSSDNTLPNLTGGYITKADKTTGGDPIAWIMYGYNGQTLGYIHELPKPENVTTQQNAYIRDQFFKLENTAHAGNVSLADGYPSVIDIPSFVDYMLINELASNADAYTFSTFFHKERNGKLRAGPIWDNDLTFGNDLFLWGFDRSRSNVWQFLWGGNDGSKFWTDLFNNAKYKCYLSRRWNELIQPGQPLNQASIEAMIDQVVATTGEAIAREHALWGTAGKYAQQIAAIRIFLPARIAWMTANLGSYSNCSSVSLPPLVITRIMYNPATSAQFTNSDDMEFIEITNNNAAAIDLTGIYFSGTGIAYQFPANSTLNSYGSVFLASNPTVFQAKYGFTPFGQFTRNLSNKGQNLVLADGFGNVIDNVNYSGSAPWPDAAGNGKYLKLSANYLDNNLASSWVASADALLSVITIQAPEELRVFPNPVRDLINIQASSPMKSISLFDLQGRLLLSGDINSTHSELNLGQLNKGIYVLKVQTAQKLVIEKINKE